MITLMGYIDLFVEVVEGERESNFAIYCNEEYLFRLVTTPIGFTLSKLDKCLDFDADPILIESIGNLIESYYL